MSDYSVIMEKIQQAKTWNTSPSNVLICQILEKLCANLDKEERCGCVSNYIKGTCPNCECQICHQKKARQ